MTVLGVIVGLELFGLGIFGPLLISYFLLLLKIYRNEFGTFQVTAKSDRILKPDQLILFKLLLSETYNWRF